MLHVETDREKEAAHQLKQANDTAARLQDKMRQAEDRERQLQMQLEKMNDDPIQLQKQKKEFGSTVQSTSVQRKQETKNYDCKIYLFLLTIVLYIITWLIIL